MKQHTLSKEVYCSGTGLHSGVKVDMQILPAPASSGIRFQRLDLPGQPVVPALAAFVTETTRSTIICQNNVVVATLEHLMSAFFGMGIDNALVQLNAGEVPILDGGAGTYAQAFLKAGLCNQPVERQYFTPRTPIIYENPVSGTRIEVVPAPTFSARVVIDFNSKELGRQEAFYEESTSYADEIAPCRTFVFLHEVLPLFRMNLVKGGDLDNALVIVEKPVIEEDQALLRQIFNKPQLKVDCRYLNPSGIRFENECARHKLLDLLGDFFLSGVRLKAAVTAYKPGHEANTQTAKIIQQQYQEASR